MKDFHELMFELGEILDIPLQPDKKNACTINFNDEIEVQLTPASDDQHLLIASFIAELPAGKFRENVLTTGLKFNHLYPRAGTLSYCERNNKLAFFLHLPLEKLTPEALSQHLTTFLEQGKLWKSNLEKGVLPVLELPDAEKKSSIFDLKKST